MTIAEANLAVIQVAAEEEARLLADRLTAAMNLDEVPVYELPPAIVAHGGPGAIGLGFFVAASPKASQMRMV